MANFDLSWSLFTGLFSICAVIPGCLIYIHCQLPSQKLRPMFESLKEADEFLLTCVEEGLVYGSDADWYRSELDALRGRAEEARFEAHAARTYAEDVANWVKGLSRQITDICWQVRVVRAEVSTTSLRERERQASLQQRAVASNSDIHPGPYDGPAVSSGTLPLSLVSADSTCDRDKANGTGSAASWSECECDCELCIPAAHPEAAASDSQTSVPSLEPVITTAGGSATELEERLSISSTSIAESLRKTTHDDRRASVSSESSRTSSMQSMRRKKRGGDPLSRARTMARFARQARATRPPVFIIDPRHLAAFEFVESDDDGDDDWVDEKAIRTVA